MPSSVPAGCDCSLSGASVALFAGRAGNLKRQRASEVAGFAAAMIGTAAFIGWWVDLPMLSSWGPGLPAMRPITALCLAALGLALICPGKGSPFTVAVGLAVATVAAFDFAVSRGMVPQAALPGPEAGSFWGSGMPLATALAAASLAVSRFERRHFLAIMLSGLAGIIAVFALIAFLAGIDPLRGSVRSPGLPTAVGLLCVVVAIVLRIGMPVLREPRPLWRLLIALASAIIGPLLLLAVYTGFRITDAQLDQTRKDLMNEAYTLSAEVDHEISSEIDRLQALAASPSLREGDFAAFHQQAEASVALRQSGNIFLVDRDMRQLVNTWVPFGTPLKKAVIREPVERALATGKPQITGVFTGPMSGKLTFAIIVPVAVGGENRYALVRSPTERVLAGLVAAHGLPAGWRAVISDAAHLIVARSEPSDGSVGRELPSSRWDGTGGSGLFEFVDPEGRPALAAYAWSQLTGWRTAVWEPKALIEAPVRALWWTIGLTALLGFSLVLGLALWLGRVIARSVSHTARVAVALGAGGPLPLDETPVAEVNTLMAELQAAAAKRLAAEDSLRESEAIFRAMFDVSSVGKMEVELGTARILRANAAMCKFVGYSEAELLARTAVDITHPDDRATSRALATRQAAGESVAFDLEKRYIRKDGKAVWARTTVNVIRDASGRSLRNTAVIQDICARKQAEQALLASKDRLQLALDAARLGSWQYDPLRHTSSGDARANEIFDFDVAENEEMPLEAIMERVHPDDVERVRTAVATALDPVDPKPFAIEYRVRRRDGKVCWVENHGLAYFEGAGPRRQVVSFVGTAQDITERKEREEKEHLLMREINHRAKNMLSVVDAIAHQTATRNPEDFIERFSERIQALSANQDLLVRNEWNGVEIADLVRAQLAHFADLIGSRIALRGPKLRLKPASAQAIGLALHELATNAGKYGSLSTDTGRAYITWQSDGDTLTMSWMEREGPPVSQPARRGFGTIVMEAMAERSVDGKVDLEYAPSGLTWRLTCPAASALEPQEP
jgi:PAS domain S-box-containing protein